LAPTPWKSILTSWPVWALIIVEAGHDWGGFTIISDLPKYMSDVLHFSITEVSLINGDQYVHRSNFKRLPYIERFIVVHPIHRSMGYVNIS